MSPDLLLVALFLGCLLKQYKNKTHFINLLSSDKFCKPVNFALTLFDYQKYWDMSLNHNIHFIPMLQNITVLVYRVPMSAFEFALSVFDCNLYHGTIQHVQVQIECKILISEVQMGLLHINKCTKMHLQSTMKLQYIFKEHTVLAYLYSIHHLTHHYQFTRSCLTPREGTCMFQVWYVMLWQPPPPPFFNHFCSSLDAGFWFFISSQDHFFSSDDLHFSVLPNSVAFLHSIYTILKKVWLPMPSFWWIWEQISVP